MFMDGKFSVIEGHTVSSVIRQANEMGLKRESYVDLIVSDGSVVLIYFG